MRWASIAAMSCSIYSILQLLYFIFKIRFFFAENTSVFIPPANLFQIIVSILNNIIFFLLCISAILYTYGKTPRLFAISLSPYTFFNITSFASLYNFFSAGIRPYSNSILTIPHKVITLLLLLLLLKIFTFLSMILLTIDTVKEVLSPSSSFAKPDKTARSANLKSSVVLVIMVSAVFTVNTISRILSYTLIINMDFLLSVLFNAFQPLSVAATTLSPAAFIPVLFVFIALYLRLKGKTLPLKVLTLLIMQVFFLYIALYLDIISKDKYKIFLDAIITTKTLFSIALLICLFFFCLSQSFFTANKNVVRAAAWALAIAAAINEIIFSAVLHLLLSPYLLLDYQFIAISISLIIFALCLNKAITSPQDKVEEPAPGNFVSP